MKIKLSKIIFIIAIVLTFNINAKAETIEAMECEYTDAYKKWLATPKSERNDLFQPPMCKTENKFYDIVGNSAAKESYTSTNFDLRNYNAVTDMENQEDTGLCWTFSTLESIESNLLLTKQKKYDLSEAHLELATQNTLFDSLVPFSRKFNSGGNNYLTAAYLMNRVGPILESNLPFSVVKNTVSGTSTPTLNDISNKKVELAVNDIVFSSQNQGVCTNESITSMKKYLVSNGALAASMYFSEYTKEAKIEGSKIKDKFINGEYYYYDGSSYLNQLNITKMANQNINHGITIIGWDDSISKDNFGITPSRNGAWLIKNSYGETIEIDSNQVDMGNKGYYYVSYDDINICSLVTGFYNIDDKVESNIYYYDKLGGNSPIIITRQTDIYLANVFKKTTNDKEELTKVSFYNFGIGQKYDIMYGTSLENMNPIYTGTADRIGIITVDIEDISLPTSDFVLGIKFYAKEGLIFPAYINTKNTYFEMEVPKNVSFMSNDGKNWGNYTDGTKDYLLPLRGYAEKITYSYSSNENKITNENITVKVDYEGINDLENISYNIYDSNDTELKTSLNSNFKIENNLSSSKTFQISLNENTKLGDYIFVTKYKNLNIKFQFSVQKLANKLVFTKYKEVLEETTEQEEDKTPDNNKKPDLVVNDNPKNDTEIPEKDNNTNNSSSIVDKEQNITENPKTGNKGIIFVILISIISLISVIVYSNNNWTKNKL